MTRTVKLPMIISRYFSSKSRLFPPFFPIDQNKIYRTENLFINKNDKFIKAKLKKSEYQTNVDKYRVATNITEQHILSKLIIPKFMIMRQLFYVKNVIIKDVKSCTYCYCIRCVTVIVLQQGESLGVTHYKSHAIKWMIF